MQQNVDTGITARIDVLWTKTYLLALWPTLLIGAAVARKREKSGSSSPLSPSEKKISSLHPPSDWTKLGPERVPLSISVLNSFQRRHQILVALTPVQQRFSTLRTRHQVNSVNSNSAAVLYCDPLCTCCSRESEGRISAQRISAQHSTDNQKCEFRACVLSVSGISLSRALGGSAGRCQCSWHRQ